MRVYKRKWRRNGVEHESRTWSVQFSVGRKLFRIPLGTTDKRAAEEKARTLLRQEERKAVGLIDPFEGHLHAPILDHVAAFEAMLRSRESSTSHVYQRRKALDDYVAACGAKTIADLDPVRLNAWTTELREGGMAARTVNGRLRALKQFSRWLVVNRRLSYDPFVSIRLLNESLDRRHVRRAFAEEELQRLVAAAAARPLAEARARRTRSGVTPEEQLRLLALGRTRALVYAVAAGTGLRRGELSRLTWADVDLERRVVYVNAQSAKSRRDQSVPLRADLVTNLKEHRPETAKAKDRVFPRVAFPTLRTFKRDMVVAGLAKVDLVPDTRTKWRRTREVFQVVGDDGRVLDFHCLRVTFVSRLVAAGVHPRTAQALARHAKIETTMAHYTDLSLLDLRGAIEKTGDACTAQAAHMPTGT